MGLIGKMTILSSVVLGEMTVLLWMIPDLTRDCFRRVVHGVLHPVGFPNF